MKIKYNFKPQNIYLERFKSGDLILIISEEEENELQDFLQANDIHWISKGMTYSLRQYGSELGCLKKELCEKSKKKGYENIKWLKPENTGCLIFTGSKTGYNQYYIGVERMTTTEFLNKVRYEDKI